MFKKLQEYLEGDASLESVASGEPSDEKLQIATGVLLLEMAGRDSDFAPEEVKAVFMAMQSQFGFEQEAEVMELLEKAVDLREKADKIDSFVAQVNSQYSEAQRSVILSMAWKVVLADGEIDKSEQKFAQQLKARLQLSDEAYKKAIEKVESGKF